MLSVASTLLNRLGYSEAMSRRDAATAALVAIFHVAAFAIMVETENGLVPKAIFLFTWGFLNFFWLAVLRRPAIAAALSLALITALIQLSFFKYEKLLMTVNFVDMMIIDADTIAFFLTIYPDLWLKTMIATVFVVPTLVLLWWFDPFRVRLLIAAAGASLCFIGAAAVSLAAPMEPYQAFFPDGYVSKFVNSGADAILEFATHGYMESDASVADNFRLAAAGSCQPAGKPPHIILILDESSFDITAAPGIKVAAGYGRHFRSFDDKERKLIVEGSGGPTWFSEYSVLTGLSARSYGRFAYFVTRIAAGRVERGLPQSLQRCGYKTFTLYPARGAFMSARGFQKSVGIEHFLDAKDMGARGLEADSFFYDQTARVIERERGSGPLFVFTYLAANHFPWDHSFRADLTPNWRNLGNPPHIDEYLRRQSLSERDYTAFLARLRRDFPAESFLAGALRRSSAGFRRAHHRPGAHRIADRAASAGVRPAVFHHLLRARRGQLQTGRHIVGARHAGSAVSAAGHSGGRGAAARSDLCRTKTNSQALPGKVFPLQRRRGGAPFQPAADRSRPDQGLVTLCPSPNHGRYPGPRDSPRLWRRRARRFAAIAALHVAAAFALYQTEYGAFAVVLAALTWALLNFVLLMVLRGPALAAVISLAIITGLIVASQFKFGIVDMTASFLDVLIIDPDTLTFLLSIYPDLRTGLLIGAGVAIPLIVLLWRLDPFRVRARWSAAGAALSLSGVVALSLAVPEQPWEPFGGVNHVSNFTRSAVNSLTELSGHGWMESAKASGHLPATIEEPCPTPAKLPHIILLLDESSFDITAAPGIKVPEGYRDHFRSSDGAARSLLMESTGGPTWYAEYNVLTGLSARSYGRLSFNVTRIAADRVERGLPLALKRCGYRTFSHYPAHGAFLSARRFQTTAGIDQFFDLKAMGAPNDLQPDSFYYNFARQLIAREHAAGPLFAFVYVTANHFPWNWQFHPDLTPDWTAPGNAAEVDEYIRRQTMSARDYSDFLARLKTDFPGEKFLVVRFGDHQPAISAKILEPGLDQQARASRIMNQDARYYATYYAIDTVNFTPADLSSALDTLEAPFLPLVVQEAAGVPLDASFAEQKKILKRCHGLFYRCAEGAEARRFNRLLIEAGLIKGL